MKNILLQNWSYREFQAYIWLEMTIARSKQKPDLNRNLARITFTYTHYQRTVARSKQWYVKRRTLNYIYINKKSKHNFCCNGKNIINTIEVVAFTTCYSPLFLGAWSINFNSLFCSFIIVFCWWLRGIVIKKCFLLYRTVKEKKNM